MDKEKIKLSEREVTILLYDLCVKLGFCLPVKVIKRITANPPTNADRFADVVYTAEGLDPTLRSDLYKAVLVRVKRAFDEHESAENGYNV